MPTLAARRAVVASELGLTREAVADRDANAIERLLFQLLTGWYPKSPMPIRVPESHAGVVNLMVHLSTVVTNRKHELTRHYRFLALLDGAEYLALAATEPALVTVTHGNFALRAVPAERGVVHQFWHETPLERGHVYDLAFTVSNPDLAHDPYWLTEESLAFHEPTRLARFDVEFKGERPDLVWCFRGLTATERPGIPGEGCLLKADAGGRVSVDMRELSGGLGAGVAWRWTQTPSHAPDSAWRVQGAAQCGLREQDVARGPSVQPPASQAGPTADRGPARGR